MNAGMKSRQKEILKYLITSAVPLDFNYFEDKFQKSERTIRYDLNELKDVCQQHEVEIRYHTKQGFYIPVSQKMKCSNLLLYEEERGEMDFLLGGDEERYNYLFLLFFVQKKRITADQIADSLYISRSTLTRMIPKFAEHFEDKAQLISYKSCGYELTGDELELRELAANILSEQFKGSYTAEDWYLLLPEMFKGFMNLHKILCISNSIKKINARYNVWISNSAFLNLLAYCIVRGIRLQNGYGVPDACVVNDENGYAEELTKELSVIDGGVGSMELDYLFHVLEVNGISVNEHELDEARLFETLKETLDILLKEETAFNGKFDILSLCQDLFGHLKNFLCLPAQDDSQKDENYPVIQEVKEHYHEFYRIASRYAKLLEKQMQMEFSDTEICYIAVYLYKNCLDKENQMKKVLIVCATGKGLSHLMAIRVEKVFPMLEIVGQVSPYQLSTPKYYQDVDFIISTTPLKDIKVPVVKISKILSAEDIKRIQGFLDYGELLDEIPLKQKDKSSFSSKEDPFSLADNRERCSRENLTYATNLLSKLILTMMEYTSKLPEKYRLSQDSLLGLIIHMSMAVPRWYQAEEPVRDEESSAGEYEKLRREHRKVFEIMEKFFELVEQALMVNITVEERIAFFLYIIKEE